MKKNILDKTAKAILIAGIVIGVCILLVRAFNNPMLKHDEVISYLASTGHQILYATDKPVDKWVLASDWQAYWDLEKVGNFGTILECLNTVDIHPPLYFWLLNLWSGIVGINTSTAALLNIPFHVLITLMIFMICRLSKYPIFASAAAATLWMVSYANLEAGIIGKQYSLLGFIVVCFGFFAINFLKKQSVLNAFWLGLFSLLGLLTHYQFIVLMGVTFAWLTVFFFLQKNLKSIIKLISSAIGTGLLFFAINPGFYNSFKNYQSQAAPTSIFSSTMPYLIYRSLYSFARLFLPEFITVSKYSKINMVVFAFLMLVLGVYFYRKLNPKSILDRMFNEKNFILVISLVTLFSVVFLYVIRVFSIVTMSVKNLLLLSPLLFIVLAQILTFFNKNHHRLIVFLSLLAIGLHLIFGVRRTFLNVSQINKQRLPEIFSSPVPILIDQTARGVLPRNLWYAHPDSPVYATTQDAIISRFPDVGDYPVLYLISSDNDYGNNPEKQGIVLKIFEDHGFSVRELGKSIFIEGKIFELNKIDG